MGLIHPASHTIATGSSKYGEKGWVLLPRQGILEMHEEWEAELKRNPRSGIKLVFENLFGEDEAAQLMQAYDTHKGIAPPSRPRGFGGQPARKAPRLSRE